MTQFFTLLLGARILGLLLKVADWVHFWTHPANLPKWFALPLWRNFLCPDTDFCRLLVHVCGPGDPGGSSGGTARILDAAWCEGHGCKNLCEKLWFTFGAHTWLRRGGRVQGQHWSHLIFLSHLTRLFFYFPSKVQSFGERIVLFILNVVIFGRLERKLDDDDMFFLPHSVKEEAKILWRDGAAVGFYTTKMKGKSCRAKQGHLRSRLWRGSLDVFPALAWVLLGENLLAQEVSLIQLSCK